VTIVVEKAKEGSSLADAQEDQATAQKRACATSVTPDAASSPGVVTDSIRRMARTLALAGRFGAGMLNKPGSLYLAQLPSFAQARDRHHECANHFSSPLLQLLRLAWGYVHMLLVKPVLNYLEVATSSPAWCFVNVIIGLAVWFFFPPVGVLPCP
jgi:hypothetical protein